MCSIAGMICLLLAAGLLGRALGRREKRYMESLRYALELLRHIRRKIDLFSTPCGEIMADVRLGDDQPVTEERLRMLCTDMGREGAVLADFLENLGSGYREDTLRLCDDTIAGLEERHKAAQREYPARAKLYTAMPLLIAVSLIVLIL